MNVNTPTHPFSGTMDVDEFMAFLQTRPKGEHWDLIEGIAVMMASPTVVHQRIAHNLCNLLHTAFAAHSFDLFAYTGLGVRTPGVP
jgi:Uma2 family endonuclease